MADGTVSLQVLPALFILAHRYHHGWEETPAHDYRGHDATSPLVALNIKTAGSSDDSGIRSAREFLEIP